MKRVLFIFISLIYSITGISATITWDGGGGDGLWATATNWVGDVVPLSTDDVILDNSSLAGSYTVTLPTGVVNTTVNTLAISPNSGNTIRLILPVLNTAAPALTINQTTGDVVSINSGGILENSNNAGSGTVISITSPGKVRINNGGRYIHNNNLSAMDIVNNLSLIAGTELGVIEYAQAASSALLSNGVTYNSVELTTTSTRIFSFSGNIAVTFRGFFKINTSITFNSTKNGDILIAGDLIINGSFNFSPLSPDIVDRRLVFDGSANQIVSGSGNFTFSADFRNIEVNTNSTVTLQRGINLSNAANTFIVNTSGTLQMGTNIINGSGIFQLNTGGWLGMGSAGGITTAPTASGNVQTGTRSFSTDAFYEYNGTFEQNTGDGLPTTITGTLKINNSSLGTNGVVLSQATTVSTGEFELTLGKLTTTSSNIISIGSAAVTTAAYSDFSFVNGPMIKYTNTFYKFPVGKGATIHPAEVIVNPAGTTNDFYTAEYFNSPISCGTISVGIHHVSGLEHWSIKSDATTAPTYFQVTLYATTYSDATDRSRLVIAMCSTGTVNWVNLGNAYTGNYGAVGLVTSLSTVSGPYSPAVDFTLASLDPAPTNPLPINLISFDASKLSNTKSSINWELAACCSVAAKFEIQRAGADKSFATIGNAGGSETNKSYNYIDNGLKNGINYYRLKMTDADGKITYSRTVAIMNGVNGLLLTSLFPTMVTNSAMLTIASSKQQRLDLVITDMQGRVMQKQNHTIAAGNTNIQLSTDRLAAGVYQLVGLTSEGKTNMIRFIK